MRTKKEIAAEIAAVKALKPKGPFVRNTREKIGWILEELEYGIDQTAEEWDELDSGTQELVKLADDWKNGYTEERPSTGWGPLVESKPLTGLGPLGE